MKTDVQAGIQDTQAKLAVLGQSRDLLKEKQRYLINISSRLTKLVRAAIDGVYADRFFESYPGQRDALDRRLRANVQRILARYSGNMTEEGHALEIVEDGYTSVREDTNRYVYREDYLETVDKLMEECRGRELPGTYVSVQRQTFGLCLQRLFRHGRRPFVPILTILCH